MLETGPWVLRFVPREKHKIPSHSSRESLRDHHFEWRPAPLQLHYSPGGWLRGQRVLVLVSEPNPTRLLSVSCPRYASCILHKSLHNGSSAKDQTTSFTAQSLPTGNRHLLQSLEQIAICRGHICTILNHVFRDACSSLWSLDPACCASLRRCHFADHRIRNAARGNVVTACNQYNNPIPK